jgi:hypothetical protein
MEAPQAASASTRPAADAALPSRHGALSRNCVSLDAIGLIIVSVLVAVSLPACSPADAPRARTPGGGRRRHAARVPCAALSSQQRFIPMPGLASQRGKTARNTF